MAVPLLIDTDPGIDDAVAIGLALADGRLDVRAIVGVGGNADVRRSTVNIARLLDALAPPRMPAISCGLEPPTPSVDRRPMLGEDGMGDSGLADPPAIAPRDYRDVYHQALESADGLLEILTLGPLTNLAAILKDDPETLRKIKRIIVSGGAVWAQGNVRGLAEFNFQRDPAAAAMVLTSGLPITVLPLDVTALVCLDESNVAHLASSGSRTGQVLARILRYALDCDTDPGIGKTHIKDAVAVGALLWPDLFLKTRMRLDVVTAGPEAGRCRPQLGGDHSHRVDLLTAVNAVDFIENLLEKLCNEAFVV